MPSFFFHAASKTVEVSLDYQDVTKKQYRVLQLQLLQDHINLHPNQVKKARKRCQKILLCAELVTSSQGQGH